MRGLLFAMVLVLAGCARKAEETGGVPVTVRGIATTDLQEYTAQLKPKVPVDMARFTAAGMKAESYTLHQHYPELLQDVTIRVEPVTLTDRMTAKSERYTRARLTLRQLDPPAPPRTGDLRGAANRTHASAATPIEWATAEMLP